MPVHLSHKNPGVHFVRAVRVMRTAVLGPRLPPRLLWQSVEPARAASRRHAESNLADSNRAEEASGFAQEASALAEGSHSAEGEAGKE